jgi:lysine-N-methylase
LSISPPLRPTYADRFQCIGSACEDTCCQGWSVPIDRAAWERYQSLPPSPLKVLLDTSLELAAPADGPPKPESFAKIRMNAQNQCPLLTEDRLCRIQAQMGGGMLSHTCATYPRVLHAVGPVQEKALTLSCPEAARLVLLNPALLEATAPVGNEALGSNGENRSGTALAGNNPTENDPAGKEPIAPPPQDFWAIRGSVLRLLTARTYPLWQRLFLLGVFCRRLDSIAKGELKRSIPDFLADFEASTATGALRPAMETLPVDREAQLDVVLRLAGLLLHRSNIHPRFIEAVQAFTTGIGNGPGATLESLTAQYSFAHDRYYEPFLRRHPHILENYLANTVIRCQFPYGKEGMKPGARPEMAREYALLTAQFALMKGLLIGVAGFHGDNFSSAHVVHTVQSAAKHFEHHPEFLKMAYNLLVESQMAGARGLAILLRNAASAGAAGEGRPASPGISAPVPPGGRSALAPDPRGTVLPA